MIKIGDPLPDATLYESLEMGEFCVCSRDLGGSEDIRKDNVAVLENVVNQMGD